MSREILFKAKRKNWRGLPKEEWWVEGYYTKGKWYLNGEEMYVILPMDLCFYTCYEISDYEEIDPETLCQYTGLTDKNGKWIWENDIVKTSKFGKENGSGQNYAGFDEFVVKWDDGGFALFNKWRRFNLREDEKSYKVSGNIFDNPELLE